MKQMPEDTVCYYCYGCNKLSLENYMGVRRCEKFIPAVKNWQEEYIEKLRRNQKK